MNKFELSSVFLTGHEKIDSDHVELVRILNKMVDSFNRQDKKCCQQQWQRFSRKLQQHFSAEEKIMHDFGFTRQTDEHQQVLEHVQALGKKCDTLKCWEDCLFEVRSELLSWILRKDMPFAEYLITIGYNSR